MHWLYSFGFWLALIVSAPWWLFRALRAGKYRAGFAQRLGRVPARLRRTAAGEDCIWIHAVSVGEVLAVGGLIEELRRIFPESRIVVSTTTEAGQKLARQRYGDDSVFYFPLDLAFCIRPYLKRLQPRLVVLAETEFWPNFLRLVKQQDQTRIAVVNARISDRSLPGYRRWRRLLGGVLNHVDLFLAQTAEDQRRLWEIRAPHDRVVVTGNLKFDQPAPAMTPLMAQLRRALPTGDAAPVIVCGSTTAGEEELLLAAFQAILPDFPRALLVLAPRHPERFAEVAAAVGVRGLSLRRRSEWDGKMQLGDVLLLDSIGELAAIYSLATVAFVGGSLRPHGGHNILEPARCGVPIIVGPHTENFRDIINLFREAQAIEVVQPGNEHLAEGLTRALRGLLLDPLRRQSLGARAAELCWRHSGSKLRTAAALQSLGHLRTVPAAAKVVAETLPS